MKKKSVFAVLRLTALAALAVLFVIPVVSTAVRSFSFGGKIGLVQYWELFVTNFTYLDFFWNSVFYAAVITAVSIAVSLPLGFLFAKVNFKGRDALFFVFILVMLLPFQATLLPNYIQLRDFNMLNTPLALTVPMMFSPFAVFLLRQFMKTVPNDLIDYTLLETSSVIRTGKRRTPCGRNYYWTVFRVHEALRCAILPQIKPAVVSLAILIFCESWNMVDQALIFSMENTGIYPLSVVLGDIPENVRYAGGTVYMFPIIMLFVMFRETLEESMVAYKL